MVKRSDFVRYKADNYTSPIFKFSNKNAAKIETSVIIPTKDGYRHGYFPSLLKQIKAQKYKNFEVIIVKGDPKPGRAINRAFCHSQGEYLIILDDDTQLGNKYVFGKLIQSTKSINRAGMIGVPNLIPAETSFLVRNIMQQIPRRHSPMVDQPVESDLAEHPCCAIPRKVFLEVGGENELIPRGIDPFLRNKIRAVGYKIAVIPDVYIHHLPPPKLKDNLKNFYQNGRKAGYVNKYFPEFVVELAHKHQQPVSGKRSNFDRIFSYLNRMIKSFFCFNIFYLLHLTLYLIGYIKGYISVKSDLDT